jgi:hypothetical protein
VVGGKQMKNKETMEFETVQSLTYLGSVVNQNETEEVQERINAGNKAFYANE